MNLVLNDPPYHDRSGRGQYSSAHNLFSKMDREDAARLVGRVMVLGAHGQIFCSDSMFYHSNRSLRAVMKKVEDLKASLEGGKGKVLKSSGV